MIKLLIYDFGRNSKVMGNISEYQTTGAIRLSCKNTHNLATVQMIDDLPVISAAVSHNSNSRY